MRIATLTFLLFAWTSPAAAWEADFHYGLTKWIALKAGFQEIDAESIAQGNVGSDSGVLDAVHLVAWYTCGFRGISPDAQASTLVRDRHFPTWGVVPAPAAQRVVDPGGAAAAAPVEEIAAARRMHQPVSLEREWILKRFGAALHGLQDSWSHRGVPDPPHFACRTEYGWGHPDQRGGLWSHRADLTWEWKDDTLEAAKATYDAMIRFRQQSPGWPALWTSSPVSWDILEPRIEIFQGSQTRASKKRWFECEGFKAVKFLDKINLPPNDPPGTDPRCTVPATPRAPSVPMAAAPFNVPPTSGSAGPRVGPRSSVDLRDLKQFLEEFLRTWMLDYGPDADRRLLDELVDPAAVAKGLGVTLRLGTVPAAEERRVTLATLSMWRIRDHGLVEQLAHGATLGSQMDSLGALGQDPSFRAPYKRLEDVTYKIAGCSDSFVVIQNGENSGDINAVTRFRHAPDDTVVLRVLQDVQTKQWRVHSIDSLVEH